MGNNCWRKTLACPIFPILLRSTLNGPFVNGNVNWLALYNSNRHPYKWENVTIKQLVIFSLDLRKETCMYMLLPDGFGEVPKEEPALVVLRGRMCLYYDHMGTHFVLWEMREFGVQESWTQLVNVIYVDLQYDWQLLPACLSCCLVAKELDFVMMMLSCITEEMVELNVLNFLTVKFGLLLNICRVWFCLVLVHIKLLCSNYSFFKIYVRLWNWSDDYWWLLNYAFTR